MRKVRAALSAPDALSSAGLTRLLESSPAVQVLPDDRMREADVVVLATDRVSPLAVSTLRAVADNVGAPVVLVARQVSASELLVAVRHNVVAVVLWAQASDDRLSSAVRTAAGGGAIMPPAVVPLLLKRLRELLEPTSTIASAVTQREVDVLRLLADGLDTADIAASLCYSERTVKKILYEFTGRLKLRNRVHAVAYALRTGII
jgi:DNA-binding NarL/FixJ family response regulator